MATAVCNPATIFGSKNRKWNTQQPTGIRRRRRLGQRASVTSGLTNPEIHENVSTAASGSVRSEHFSHHYFRHSRRGMKTSYILNTACLDPKVRHRSNPYVPGTYGERAELIREKILPSLEQFDEIIVAGVFEPGDNYTYVNVPSTSYRRSDALRQREAGARRATGDILVFGHDDHRPESEFAEKLQNTGGGWDLLVPKRIHEETNRVLNNGRDADYMGGHVLALKRALWARVPWTSVVTSYWDVPMTRLWREADAEIVFSDEIVHYDLERR